MAVPTGCSALDENTYGVRFYAVVGSKYQYLFSFWDNGSGNRTGISPVAAYTSVFRDLRTPVDQAFSQSEGGHQTKSKRYIFCDNFYTRHVLARKILKFTDNEICMIGTIRFNLVDGGNRPTLKKALSQMSDKGRGA